MIYELEQREQCRRTRLHRQAQAQARTHTPLTLPPGLLTAAYLHSHTPNCCKGSPTHSHSVTQPHSHLHAALRSTGSHTYTATATLTQPHTLTLAACATYVQQPQPHMCSHSHTQPNTQPHICSPAHTATHTDIRSHTATSLKQSTLSSCTRAALHTKPDTEPYVQPEVLTHMQACSSSYAHVHINSHTHSLATLLQHCRLPQISSWSHSPSSTQLQIAAHTHCLCAQLCHSSNSPCLLHADTHS